MIYVAGFATFTTAVFGGLWLATLRQLHAAEVERDECWDQAHNG